MFEMLLGKLKEILRNPSLLLRSEAGFGAVVLLSVLLGNYLVFTRLFLGGQYVFGGDTYFYWSFKYVMLYSIKHFGELPWWDPTNFGGYPLYYHFLSGWSNYLSPYYLPSLILFKLLNVFRDISINGYIIFHQTVYIVFLNMAAIYLISRELVKNRIAAVLPVLIFGFSYFQLLNFHDFYAVEAMVAPLFYVYGLIRFNNRRSIGSLILFLVLFGMLCASLQNGILMSAVFWGTIFTVLMLVFNPGMVKDGWRLIKEYIRPVRGKIVMGLLVLMIISGFAAAWLPFHYNAGHVLKYRGAGGKQPVAWDSSGGLTDQALDIQGGQDWTIFTTWMPFSEIHDNLTPFAWDGHQNRYIGLVTLPLIFAAMTIGLSNRYVYILFLTHFICNAFAVYATDNIVYKILTDNSDIFQNIANMSTIFPRGGPVLFLILLSAIGLDMLINRSLSNEMIPEGMESCNGSIAGAEKFSYSFFEKFFLSLTMILIMASLLIFGAVIFGPLFSGFFPAIRHSLGHIAIYLLLFSFLSRALILSNLAHVRRGIVFCIFLFTLTDLSVSVSSYILKKNIPDPGEQGRYIGMHIVFPYSEVESRGMVLPDSLKFGPSGSEADQMFPPGYMGVYHNTNRVNWSTREWLVLETREKARIFLENWNHDSVRMRRYPDFRFFTNGYYIPFEKIRELDSDQTIFSAVPLFYLHDSSVVNARNADPGEPVTVSADLSEYTFNKVVMRSRTDKNGFLYFLDNYDPFWQVFIDGKEAKVLRANFTYKAVALPAGEHIIKWVYNPWPVKAAYFFFYAILLVCAGFLFVWYRKSRTIQQVRADLIL